MNITIFIVFISKKCSKELFIIIINNIGRIISIFIMFFNNFFIIYINEYTLLR